MSKQVINPLKGKTEYGWHFEQNVYDPQGLVRAIKSGGGSGNIPKVIIYDKDKTSNQKGFVEMINGGVCDFNYVSSKTRRGRVQGGG